MIAVNAVQGRTLIAGKRLARSFGHWTDKAPPARPDTSRPDPSVPPPSAPAARSSSPSRASGGGETSLRGRPDFTQLAASDETRTRLQLLAKRRDDGELTGEIEDSLDSDEADSPSAATRRSLRSLADRWSRASAAPAIPPPDRDEALWNRVMGVAAPLLNPPGDPPAR